MSDQGVQPAAEQAPAPPRTLELHRIGLPARQSIAHARQPLIKVDRGKVYYLVYLAATKTSLVIDRVAEGEITSGIIAIDQLVDFVREAD